MLVQKWANIKSWDKAHEVNWFVISLFITFTVVPHNKVLIVITTELGIKIFELFTLVTVIQLMTTFSQYSIIINVMFKIPTIHNTNLKIDD